MCVLNKSFDDDDEYYITIFFFTRFGPRLL